MCEERHPPYTGVDTLNRSPSDGIRGLQNQPRSPAYLLLLFHKRGGKLVRESRHLKRSIGHRTLFSGDHRRRRRGRPHRVDGYEKSGRAKSSCLEYLLPSFDQRRGDLVGGITALWPGARVRLHPPHGFPFPVRQLVFHCHR
jgi:hypothetical protein